MKSGKLIAGLLLVGVLAFFAVRELRLDQASGKKRTEEIVFPYASTKIDRITLTLPAENKHAVWARDASGQWRVEEGPEGTDPGIAPELVGAWSRVRFKEIVEEQPADLGRYGLQTPLATLTCTIKPEGPGQPARQAALYVGEPFALQPAYYAKVDQFERVVLVSVDASDFVEGVGRKAFGLEPTLTEMVHQ